MFDFLADLPEIQLPPEPDYDMAEDLNTLDAPAEHENSQEIASEISSRLEELIGAAPEPEPEPEPEPAPAPAPAPKPRPVVRPLHPESATIKFEDLKFGRNYNPTGKN